MTYKKISAIFSCPTTKSVSKQIYVRIRIIFLYSYISGSVILVLTTKCRKYVHSVAQPIILLYVIPK